jgi:hypothetical protein
MVPNGTETPTADESAPPFDGADAPPAPSDDVRRVTTAADSAGPGLADLSVAAYGAVALSLLVVFVFVRE